MTLASGTRLGRYEIRHKLGSGGMGEVYLAWDPELEREVAIKVLRADHDESPERTRRFVQEAKAASAFSHPNVAHVYEIGTAGDLRYIAMEVAQGETLRQRIVRGDIPVDDVISIGSQIAAGLAAAHGSGIVHRDMKPENVMVRPDGYVKVLDFGLAKLVRRDIEAETLLKTGAGVVMGTPRYMAPEQFGGSDVTPPADVFSLGVVLYEMLTGSRPFDGDDNRAVARAILSEDPVPPTKLRNAIPSRLCEVLMKALQKDPELRYPSAAELLEDLKLVSRETAAAAFESSRTELAAPRRHGRTVIALTLVALIVAAAGIATYRAQRVREARVADVEAQHVVDASERSIAVLPFQNLSAEAENAFFAAGVHEDVLTYLSRVADLKVISRSSVMQYAAPDKNLRAIAADLGVVYVVEGSVRRAGGRVRVAAQLIDARTDEHLWAENYDRELADVFTIQTAIAQEIVAALKATLSPREARMLASRPTTSVEAYDLFLRARQLIQQLDVTDSSGEPIRLLEDAIRLDPQFAHAYALLATEHGKQYWFLADRSPARLERMKSAIDRAFALRPDLPEARVALGQYYYRGFYDYPRAVEELEKARLSLPNDSLVQYHLGLAYRRLGEADRSIDSFVQATRLDPANLRAYAESVGTARAFGRADRGVALAEAGLRRFPGDPGIAGEYAFLYLDHFGDTDRARAILDAAEPGPVYWDAQYYSRLYAHEYRRAAEAALEPSVFESAARGWGRTQAAQALLHGGFDAEAKKMLIEAEKILVAELDKPYAENYGWPHLVYALNLALQSRGDEAIASCDRAVRILPFERDQVHGAVFRQECAWVKAMAGRTDEALAEIALYLDHGYAFTRWQLALDPRWDFLRDNPRFRELSAPKGTATAVPLTPAPGTRSTPAARSLRR